MTGIFGRHDPASALRAGLILLVVVGVVGTALSLAYERHWMSALQWAPWITLGVITVAAAALTLRPAGVTVRLARAAAVLAILSSVFGAWQHIDANLDPDHDHGDHAQTATTSSDDEETAASSDHHHGDDEETASSRGHHHADDEETPPPTDSPAADEDAESSEASMAEVLTGSAGSVPVPAALAIAPVGLALALATIGLGGRRTPPPP